MSLGVIATVTVTRQSATIVSDKNEFVVGDDLALVQGDKKNNVLIHKGAGEVLGAEGDDTLIPAFEARGWTFDPATGLGTGLDIRGVAHALSVSEERIITHAAAVNDNQLSAWPERTFYSAGRAT
jgi:hypothetical protein